MKSIFAVFVCMLLFIIGWLALAAILFAIQMLVISARPGLGLFHFIHSMFTWIAGPCFGAFVGVYISAKIFRSVSILTIRSSFISILFTLISLTVLFNFFLNPPDVGLFDILTLFAQLFAVVIGAKLATVLHSENIIADK